MKKKILLFVGILFLLAGIKGIVQWASFDVSRELEKFDRQVMIGINDLDSNLKTKFIKQREKYEMNILGAKNDLAITGIVGLLLGSGLIYRGVKS